ncbi:MAG: response regulator, partial [Myxococcales bacterium]|nr:response regulator [Myxococcales bacterium]
MARILHIEDNASNRLLVRKVLSGAGHEVIDATTGPEGIALAAKEKPDVVLVDLHIPELDGYEVILRLRGMGTMRKVPIVAVTGVGDKQTALAVGADGFVAKPIDAARLPAIVGRFLGGHRERGDKTGPIRLREKS